MQGYVAGVWAVASVLGPALGGVFSEFLSWRWIFFVNLPLGAIAAWMLYRKFAERVERTRHRIDYAGAGLLITGCTLLILALLEGGVAWGWGSVVGVLIFVASAAALVGFVLVERRAAEPVLPLWVFTRRTLVGGTLVALVVGATLMGLSSFLPTYAQGVLGHDALTAGFALAALTVGWPIAASLSGRLYMRIGFRDTAFIGAGLIVVGVALTTLLGENTSLWSVAGAAFVVGAGLGLASSPTIVASQSSVGWERRGVVTATNMFGRSLGSAVGAAVFGAIANATLAERFAHPPAAVAGHLPDSADATSLVLGQNDHSAAAEYVRDSLTGATHNVFVAIAAVAALSIVALALMPRKTEQLKF